MISLQINDYGDILVSDMPFSKKKEVNVMPHLGAPDSRRSRLKY